MIAKKKNNGSLTLLTTTVFCSLVSSVRILHVASARRANVEAVALSANEFISLMCKAISPIKSASGGRNCLHQDAAFMVEILLKVFTDALGDVDYPFESSGRMSSSERDPLSNPGDSAADGGVIDARSAPDPAMVALEKSKTSAGAPRAAHGRAALMNAVQTNALLSYVVDGVLENPSASEVMDPSALKVHAVALLKLLIKDPGFGDLFAITLEGIPAWSKYAVQDHSLFITGSEQKSDYFLCDGGAKDRKLLKGAEESAGASERGDFL